MSKILKSLTRVGLFVSVMMLVTMPASSQELDIVKNPQRTLLKEQVKAMKAEVKGKEFFLQTNLWHEEGRDILSTNFHRGTLLPLGTRVTIERVSKDTITFTVNQGGARYNLLLAKKHTRLNIYELFASYFGETNPLEQEAYKGLSKKDKEYVQQGVICSGMSKKAVLMSYGFPPSHKTPSLDAAEWSYWENRIRRIAVSFADNAVSEVVGYSFQCNE